MTRLALLLACWLLALTAAASADETAIGRCRELLPVFVENPEGLTDRFADGGPDAGSEVRLDWSGSSTGPGHITCRFLPHAAPDAPWQMQELLSSRFGRLSRYDIQQAYKMLHVERSYAPQSFAGGAPLTVALLYFLQQSLNGIGLGCVYALIALGYTMVFGITRVINFTWGPLYAFAAFTTLIGVAAGGWRGPDTPAIMLPVLLLAAMATTALWGWASDRLVFRPLRRAAGTVPLIAAIGLTIAMQELLRLAQGPRTRYLVLLDSRPWLLIGGHGFDVYLSPNHLLVGAVTLLLMLSLWWLQKRSRFGRSQRASAQDPRMAALLGVDVDRTIGLTFLIGGALVGAAGLFAAGQYGVITFKMGALVSLKALTASVLGGIGSLPGAVLGGLLVALIESWTAAYLASDWKEVVLFALLVGLLWLRPQGLLGTPRSVSADEPL